MTDAIGATDPDADLLYLFGFVAGDIPADWKIAGLTEESTARIVELPGADLRAAVQSVEASSWTGPEAEERLRDVEWVGPRAVRHEAILEELERRGAVFPMRFSTLFRSRNSLEERVRGDRDTIDEYLTLAARREEWSVKGYLHRDEARRHLDQHDDGPSSGTDYLKQKSKERESSGAVESWLRDLAPELFETYRSTAADAAVRDSVEGPDEEAETAFHWAFWIESDDLPDFQRVSDRLQPRLDASGLELRIEGPWPAYSFRPQLDSGVVDSPET